MTKINFKRDGLTLVGQVERPFAEKYDLAILLHGLGDNQDTSLMRKLSSSLRNAGIANIRFDFSGQGGSSGKLEEMTIFSELADASTVLEEVRSNPHVNNIYLIGHSMGGVVATLLADLYPDLLPKLVLLAPAASLKDYINNGELMGTSFDPNNIPNKVRAGKLTLGSLFFRSFKNLSIYESAGRYKGEVNIIQGTNDEAVAVSYAQKFDHVFPNSQLNLIENADHSFTESFEDKAVDQVIKFLK